MRAKIKAMNYGLAYGLSAYGLGQQLGIEPAEARGLMDEYFQTFGGIRDYLGGVVEEARKSGFTETIRGRRRYLPDLTSDNRQRRGKDLVRVPNYPTAHKTDHPNQCRTI